MEDDDIIQLKTDPVQCRENQPAPITSSAAVEPAAGRSKLTKAERNYRRSIFSTVIMLIFVLLLIIFIVLGAASMYAIKTLAAYPQKSYIIHDTAKKLENTEGIEKKIDVLRNGIEKFISGESEVSTKSKSGKSGGGKFKTIRDRNEMSIKAANSGN